MFFAYQLTFRTNLLESEVQLHPWVLLFMTAVIQDQTGSKIYMENSRNEWRAQYKLYTHWLRGTGLEYPSLATRLLSVHTVALPTAPSAAASTAAPLLCGRMCSRDPHFLDFPFPLFQSTVLHLAGRKGPRREAGHGEERTLSVQLWGRKKKALAVLYNCRVTATACKYWLKIETTLNYRAPHHVCPEGLGMWLPRMKGDHC